MQSSLQHIIRDIFISEMEENRISQSELARRMGISRTAVQKTLFDESNWTIARMERVANALGLNLHISVKSNPDSPKLSLPERIRGLEAKIAELEAPVPPAAQEDEGNG